MLYNFKKPKKKGPIHTLPIASRLSSDVNRALEEGRSWVRRNFRIWPWDHDLDYEIKTVEGKLYMELYFVSKYPEDDDDDDEDYTSWQW